MKTHREKWRIRFTGGDIILALFATNVGIDREAQTSRISPDSDRSPRVVDDFQLSRRGTRREKREKRMEGSVHAAHTRALLLFTGIGARVRAYYSSGSALPFIRHCPRTLCGERARTTRTHGYSARGTGYE